jgi:hypothetical protein
MRAGNQITQISIIGGVEIIPAKQTAVIELVNL